VLEGNSSLRMLGQVFDPGGEPQTLAARASMSAALGEQGTAASTLIGNVPTTVFSAGSPAALKASMQALVGYGPWSQLRGSLAVWRPGDPAMLTVANEDAPFVAYSLRGGLGLWISQYPWWALGILLSAMALLAWLTRRALALYRRRNLMPPTPGQRREDKGGPR
jgi:hypothetical protein